MTLRLYTFASGSLNLRFLLNLKASQLPDAPGSDAVGGQRLAPAFQREGKRGDWRACLDGGLPVFRKPHLAFQTRGLRT